MLSEILTNYTAEYGSVAGTILGYNEIFGGWPIFSILIAIFIVVTVAYHRVGDRDFMACFMNVGYIMVVASFILMLVNVDGKGILEFSQFMVFVVLTGLSMIYNWATA